MKTQESLHEHISALLNAAVEHSSFFEETTIICGSDQSNLKLQHIYTVNTGMIHTDHPSHNFLIYYMYNRSYRFCDQHSSKTVWFFKIEMNTMGISPISLLSKSVSGQKNSVLVDQILHQERQLVCVETARQQQQQQQQQQKQQRS